MAIQFAPIATIVAKYGGAALAGFAVAHAIPKGRLSPAVAREMDQTPDGLRVRRSPGQIFGSFRARRVFRPVRALPRLHLDATALVRLKLRRAR